MKRHPFYLPEPETVVPDEAVSGVADESVSETDAEDEADHARQQQEELDRLRDEARREGVEQGRRQGFEKGIADARSMVEPLEARLKEAIDAVEASLAEGKAMVAERIRDLGVDLAEALVGTPGVLDRADLLKNLLQEAEDERSGKAHVVCRLHPDTAEHFGSLLADVMIERDETLEPGGAIVETRNADTRQAVNRWDASIERQIESLRDLKTASTEFA